MKKISKKILGVVVLCGLITLIMLNSNYDIEVEKKLAINGDYFALLLDDEKVETLPSAGTYLIDYVCDNNSEISWNRETGELTLSKNTTVQENCSLFFKSKPLVSELPQGSYVAYEGNNGCLRGGIATKEDGETGTVTENSNSCLGYNANANSDGSASSTTGTYGYCYSSSDSYYVSGWRIAYTNNERAYLISAGAPECYSVSSTNYVSAINAKARKYCNYHFVDDCSSDVDAHAINNTDFNKMTAQATGTAGGYINNSFANATACSNNSSLGVCGYNNNLLEPGGNYWFAEIYSSTGSTVSPYCWYGRDISGSSCSKTGVRPVIRLSSEVYVTSGSGTMDDPYTISNYSFRINSDDTHTASSSVNLGFVGENVSQMCISNTETCTNYETFSSSKNWTLTNGDGTKTVYVYYKDSEGNLIATLMDTIVLDTTPPTNNSIVISDGTGVNRTLTLSSTGADYMCFSNTSSNVEDCTEWVEYNTTYPWTLTKVNGEKTIYAFFKDSLGNIAGPYSATITCTDCEYKYFIDSYMSSSPYIFIVRGDGATARVTATSSSVAWYALGSQLMHTCGTYVSGSNGYTWCIGKDNNAYYKTYNGTSWTQTLISDYIDIASHSYFVTGAASAYIVRYDGMLNGIKNGALLSTDWTLAGYNYGAGYFAACSSNSSGNRVGCVSKDGYYYYTDATGYFANTTATTAYKGGVVKNLENRTSENTWIELNGTSGAHVIEADGTNLYNAYFSNSATSATWYTSSLPGGGVRTCTGIGTASSGYIYCLANDGYLYQKTVTKTSWTKTPVQYE